jgi:hypothetical protein
MVEYMNKKLFIIGLVVVVIVVVVSVVVSSQQVKIPKEDSPLRPTVSELPTIKIGDVTVSDFYKNAVDVSDSGDVLLVETPEFSISYVAAYEKFIITLDDPYFVETRTSAEQSFLNILNVSETEACKLEVEETVPIFLENEYAGGVYYLSFCEPQ